MVETFFDCIAGETTLVVAVVSVCVLMSGIIMFAAKESLFIWVHSFILCICI